jgi:hypothetical protein
MAERLARNLTSDHANVEWFPLYVSRGRSTVWRNCSVFVCPGATTEDRTAGVSRILVGRYVRRAAAHGLSA